MTMLPTFTPTAFNFHHACGCRHCGCMCAECTGLIAKWWAIGNLISDRAIALPADAFDPPPPIFTVVAGIPEFEALLTADYDDKPSTEHFHPRYLDPLERAGLRVRPRLADHRQNRTHGILQDGKAVGLLMPLNSPKPPCRMAS